MSSEYQKFFPSTFELETPRIRLRQLREDDYEALQPLTGDSDIWTYFTKDLQTPAELRSWISDALADQKQEKRVPFVVMEKDTEEICGSTSFGNISFYDKRIEIGWSWLGKAYMGIGVNRHAKFALLCYAFEVMQMERVEIKTDVLNERARAALLKVGMIPEGVLRSHQQMHSNRRRDTIYYAILRSEWPARKASFFADLVE